MGTTKKIKKLKDSEVLNIEFPLQNVFKHFMGIDKAKVSFCCMGNSKWIDIYPVEDLTEMNYCYHCGAKLDAQLLHNAVSKLIPPNQRFTG